MFARSLREGKEANKSAGEKAGKTAPVTYSILEAIVPPHPSMETVGLSLCLVGIALLGLNLMGLPFLTNLSSGNDEN